jgi:4-oxalocrotonate tautomerase
MPLVRISLIEGKTEEYVRKVADAVHRSLVETISIPPQDRFQIITEHKQNHFIYDLEYLGIRRTADLIIVQITMSAGRSLDLRKALFMRIAQLLSQEVGLRKEDVFVNLVEVAKENWSFGNGEAQYAI